ncbi:MAG: hypothetical protein FWB94_07645 [Chitinispirillia bacterium]|nr:hypothetical protein [Chitinispirillia bacterium]
MFTKKRPAPWFVDALLNLGAAAFIYALARRFQGYAQKQGTYKKYKGRR